MVTPTMTTRTTGTPTASRHATPTPPGALAGYALAFSRWRAGSRALSNLLVLAAFIPLQLFLYPAVLGLAWVGLFGSLAGAVLAHVVFGLPLTTILFKSHFEQLP